MDNIVAACQFRDSIYIFTSYGHVWRMDVSFTTGEIQFHRVHSLFPV
jgi:hypothetical protein